MSKRRCCEDESIEELAAPVSSKITRGLFARCPVEPPPRPRNEVLLAALADRSRPSTMEPEECHRLFAEELACLNERFVNYCRESVEKDRHCFLFTGFNDYMEHFMGLFATFLAPLTDSQMTWLCFQRLREHCSSKFANVGKYVSQVKDASTCTETTVNTRYSPACDTVDTVTTPLDRIRSTFDLARRVSSSSSIGGSSAGRRRREVMKAMQQLMQVQVEPTRVSTPVSSFGPILLKNFNFGTVNSTLKENVTSLECRRDQNRKYFKLRREMEATSRSPSRASTPQDASEIHCSNRVWSCEQCKATNHADCEQCCVCSHKKGAPVVQTETKKNLTTTKPVVSEPTPIDKPPEENPRKDDVKQQTVPPPVSLVNGGSDVPSGGPMKLVLGPKGWDCPVCLVKNTDDKDSCVCCQASRPSGTKSASSPPKAQENENPPSAPPQMSPPWFCSVCMKVQTGCNDRCKNCGTERKQTISFGSVNSSMPTTNSLATPGAFKPPSVANVESLSENKPASSDGEEDSAATDMMQSAVDHCEKDAIFAAKCKMYYRSGDKYVLKSVGFLNVLNDDDRGRKLLFRADNFTGSTMLTARVTPMMKPTVVGSNNVSILTIAYPPFYSGQDISKPVLVLFKLKSNDDAKRLVEALQ